MTKLLLCLLVVFVVAAQSKEYGDGSEMQSGDSDAEATTTLEIDLSTDGTPIPNYDDGGPSKKAIFGLTDPNEDIKDTGISVSADDSSVTLRRYQHFIDGFPVWNSIGVLVETVVLDDAGNRSAMPSLSAAANKVFINAAPLYAQGVSARMKQGVSSVAMDILSRRACQRVAVNKLQNATVQSSTIKFTSNRYIFVQNQEINSTDSDNVILVDDVVVTGRLQNGTLLAHRCLCNAYNHNVILHWNHMPTVDRIYGGNQKLGQWQYGAFGKPSLPYSQSGNNGKCRFESSDGKIKVFNARNMVNFNPADLTTEFNCNIGQGDSANGAFGVLADIFYNAVKSKDMYLDANWGGLNSISTQRTLNIYGHYSTNHDNAFFDTSTKSLYVGDGASVFYPLGSCLDIMAHEMGHSVTSMYSDLVYTGESGCLNEAFSDAMGQMAKAYTSTANFLIGDGCVKNAPSLRNMKEPTQYSKYFAKPCSPGDEDCVDPHDCSSIMNYIFYKLASSNGWSVQLAGRALIAANKVAWKQFTTLKQAGCDVANIVQQLNYANGDTKSVKDAWRAAGIDISSCMTTSSGKSQPPPRNSSNNTTNSNNNSGAKNGQAYSSPRRAGNCLKQMGILATSPEQLVYVITPPINAARGYVQINAASGDADLYVNFQRPPTKTDYAYSSKKPTSGEFINVLNIQKGADVYILIDANKSFEGLWLIACFW